MEKDIGRISKNNDTDIVIRIDDFGGKTGLTIREFVKSSPSGYSGFTKSGTRISAEKFLEFREIINSIKLEDLKPSEASKEAKKPAAKEEVNSEVEDY